MRRKRKGSVAKGRTMCRLTMVKMADWGAVEPNSDKIHVLINKYYKTVF